VGLAESYAAAAAAQANILSVAEAGHTDEAWCCLARMMRPCRYWLMAR